MPRLLITAGLLLTATAGHAQALTASADTARFPVGYCTALPRASFEQWDNDYARYERWLTPEIRKTQVGLRFQHEGVYTWTCRPSASPHAQLDTATVVRDAARLQGSWRVVAQRLIIHTDSVSFADKRIHRKVTLLPGTAPGTLTLADGKFRLTEINPASGKPRKTHNARYELVNQRYLLVYGLSKAAAAVQQVGLDSAGRLVLHNCGVTERKIPGRYQVYQTAISQLILERQ